MSTGQSKRGIDEGCAGVRCSRALVVLAVFFAFAVPLRFAPSV